MVLDWASQVVLVLKNSLASTGRLKKCGFNPWVWKIPWRRPWQRTPLFLPGDSHGQRSLAGYGPLDHTALETIERLTHYTKPVV